MSQSFENRIGERLREYAPPPPSHLREQVLGKVGGTNATGFNGWQMFSVVLATIALLQIFPGPYQVSKNVINEEVSVSDNLENADFKVSPKQEGSTSISTAENNGRKEKIILLKTEKEVIEKDSRGSGPDIEPASNAKYVEFEASPKSLSTNDQPRIPGIHLLKKERRRTVPVKPERERNFDPYGELGAFFLYQQAKPNLEDDIVIDNFQGQGRISPSRLGLSLEGGVHKIFDKRIRLNFGTNISTYRQAYQFTIRNTEPEGATVIPGETASLIPVFDESLISIDHRLWSIGGKFGISYNLFTATTTQLNTTIEYQHILNREHNFYFQDEQFKVNYPNQVLLSAGIRKTIFITSHGTVDLVPSIRYSLRKHESEGNQVLSVKPFSVGLSLSYLFGK